MRRRTPLTSAEARTVAFMDIGINSIRLLLVRLHPEPFVHDSDRTQTDPYALARRGVRQLSTWQPAWHGADRAGCQRVCRTGTRQWGETRSWQWPRRQHAKPIIRTPLCSACRQRPNSTCESSPGLEEARLIYLGVSHGVHLERQAGVLYRYWRWQHGSDHWRSAPACLCRVTQTGRHPSHHALPA